jgi:hypothetical protein
MDEFNFKSTDYWFKIVEFLQQNWAVIEPDDSGACGVYFFGDTSGVFDQLNFSSIEDAESSLVRNGFRRYDDDKQTQEFIAKPQPPFRKHPHPNGPIYSSGRFWR